MTPTTIAAGLSEGRKTHEDLTANWDAFCDGDPLPHPRDNYDNYPTSLEALGYVELVSVDDEALDDAFAYERGIEAGGMMWRLTELGLAVRDVLKEAGR